MSDQTSDCPYNTLYSLEVSHHRMTTVVFSMIEIILQINFFYYFNQVGAITRLVWNRDSYGE